MAGASVREACHEASRLISVVLIIGVTFPGLSYRVLTYMDPACVRTYVSMHKHGVGRDFRCRCDRMDHPAMLHYACFWRNSIPVHTSAGTDVHHLPLDSPSILPHLDKLSRLFSASSSERLACIMYTHHLPHVAPHSKHHACMHACRV